ncbi:MAG TPA: DUF1295 domain-containing protein [Bacteroidales bacterium]|nr:DUF1295 domain-containing protein [Bacteroidales bacterium]
MIKLIIFTSFTGHFANNNHQLQQLAGTWIIIMLAAAILCFAVSEITQNYSQVDKLWSLMPIIYSLVTLVAFPTPRILLMTLLITAWGLRLSYNFGRKAGYSIIPWKGEEDYRWKILRENPALKGRIRFGLFNLFFISFYQHFLILLFSTPLLIAAKYNSSNINLLDLFAAFLLLIFLTVETIADNQLFRFHRMKKQGLKDGLYKESLEKGFMSEGLWRYSRHPNFASEQSIWLSFYLFSIAASGVWLNWTVIGAVLLIFLFAGSTYMTESISSSKYPAYIIYQKNTAKFFPKFFRK